jgi:hypothetical protein
MVSASTDAKHVCNRVHACDDISRCRGICIGYQATGGEPIRALVKLRLGRLFLGLGVVLGKRSQGCSATALMVGGLPGGIKLATVLLLGCLNSEG